MQNNSFELMRLPELFLGTSTTFETVTINSNGANYAAIFQVEEDMTIEQVGVNVTGRTGGSANCRMRLREVNLTNGLMVAAGAGYATTGNFDIGTLTANANGKMNYKTLQTPYVATRGQLLALDFEGLGGMGGANTVTIAYRIANTVDAIGPRYRFPYAVTNANAIKREGAWFGLISTAGKYYGFNPLSVKSNAADVSGYAYGNFFTIPGLGNPIRCTGMKVCIAENVTIDTTYYELWSYTYGGNATLLTSVSLSSGIRNLTAGYNKLIYFPTAVNLSPNTYYAITVRSSDNNIDYKFLQFEDAYFLASMQSFGNTNSTYYTGGIQIDPSNGNATQLGRHYLMSPLFDTISAPAASGTFTANFTAFNG